MKNIIPATNNFVFQYTLGSEPNADVLQEFLSDHLTFDEGDELDEIEIKNPFLLVEFSGDKYGILDIKCKTKHGKIIDVEMQVILVPYLTRRSEFYLAKMITEQVGSGDNYNLINPVISILILAENMFDDDIYHHCFKRYDPKAGMYFSDLTTIHVLELKKLKKEDDGTAEWLWGRLFTAASEEELNMLSVRKPAISKAVTSIRHCSEDERMRELAESYEKARLEQASMAYLVQKAEVDIKIAKKTAADAKKETAAIKKKAAEERKKLLARIAELEAQQKQ